MSQPIECEKCGTMRNATTTVCPACHPPKKQKPWRQQDRQFYRDEIRGNNSKGRVSLRKALAG